LNTGFPYYDSINMLVKEMWPTSIQGLRNIP